MKTLKKHTKIGILMDSIRSYYLIGFILLSAILNVFIEKESIGIKLLCLLLLFITFILAVLLHSLKIKVAKEKTENVE